MRHKPELVDLRFDLYGKRPRHIAAGDNHVLWVTCAATTEVVALFSDESIQSFPTDAPPDQITRGETTIWFTMPTIDRVGRIDAQGNLHSHALPAGSAPTGITTIGHDAWVTLLGTAELAKVSPDGAVALTRPTVEGDEELGNPANASGSRFIAADERGSLWFTRSDLADIVRLDPDGTTESWTSPDWVDPWAISVGRDAVWITDAGNGGGIWRIGRSEKLLQRVEPWPRNTARSIAADSTAGCWFTEEDEDLVAHLGSDDRLTEWDLFDYGEHPRGVAVDQDGVAWVVLRTGGVVGILAPAPKPDADVPDYTVI